MSSLLILGGGLFGSPAAALARQAGWKVRVFDAGLPGAASAAAAGLFREEWAGKKWKGHFRTGLDVLQRLYGVDQVNLADPSGHSAPYLFVPPRKTLEADPIRERVTAVGDGWLEAGGERYEGYVYVAAGIWSRDFLPKIKLIGKAGAAFTFAGERPGQIRPFAPGRQVLAFVRDPGSTYCSDGTAEEDYLAEHDRLTLARAAELGLIQPTGRLHGYRPYTPGGPVFQRLASRTWLATGGRKMGTIFGAAFAHRLLQELP